MKELDDEELQHLFEHGHIPSEKPLNEDEKAYSILFEALGKEPENGLPYNFAAKVTRHVRAEQKRGNELKSNLVAAVLFLVVIAIVCYAFTLFAPDTTSTLLKYKWMLLFLPIAFVAIQYFDQKLIKTRLFNSRSYKP